MLYELVKITDLDDNNKEDEDSINRIGRIFDIDTDNIVIGKSLYMTCVKPNWLKSVITSHVNNYIVESDGIVIVTDNSKYYLMLFWI